MSIERVKNRNIYRQCCQIGRLIANWATFAFVLKPGGPDIPGWTFLSNHAHVLLCLALDEEMRIRDIGCKDIIIEFLNIMKRFAI